MVIAAFDAPTLGAQSFALCHRALTYSECPASVEYRAGFAGACGDGHTAVEARNVRTELDAV
jgi:hypothetical protein